MKRPFDLVIYSKEGTPFRISNLKSSFKQTQWLKITKNVSTLMKSDYRRKHSYKFHLQIHITYKVIRCKMGRFMVIFKHCETLGVTCLTSLLQ